MAQLVMAVHLTDPQTHRPVVLLPGEEPAPHLAALITNPDAWEDGILPAAENTEDDAKDTSSGGDSVKDTKQAAPAAKKTAATRAARTPARGRAAAGEGDSGD